MKATSLAAGGETTVDNSASRQLADLEAVIERGRQTFIEVGTALTTIREARLYREDGYDTFEEYCQERWGWKRAHAYRLMDAASVVSELSPNGDIPLPVTESHARELVPLKDNPPLIREVWGHVVQEHGDDITAAKIRDAVRAVRSPKEERAAARAQGQAEQEQSDRLAAVAFTPDSETVRKAPLRAFLADFDRFTAFLKNNPPAQIAPALSGSDWIWIENGIIFTFRKWCDEMEREMNAGIRVIGGTDA